MKERYVSKIGIKVLRACNDNAAYFVRYEWLKIFVKKRTRISTSVIEVIFRLQ